jgi:hypothetical protein
MKRKIILLCVLLLLLLIESVYAMSSPAYHIDWLNLLSGSGGPARSAGYQANFTIGQTASRGSSSSLFNVQMGYWAGIPPQYPIFLPKIVKFP